MRIRKALLLASFFAASFGSAHAQAVELSSRVEAVTVYPAGATVTRVADAALIAGSNEIELVGLVELGDIGRVRVEVDDSAVHIGQIQLSAVQQRDAYDVEVVAQQAKIDAQIAEMYKVADSTAAAKLQLKFLEGIATGYAQDAGYEGARGAANPASWQSALQILMSASEEANQLIRANDAKAKEQSKDLSVLQRELQALHGAALESSRVALSLRSERATNVKIRLHYYQEDARWSPRYEARLDSDSGALQLTQQADISQETDEDWRNVQLTLSTSEPSGELQAPVLASEILNLYSPVQEFARRSKESAFAAAPPSLDEIVVTGMQASADVGDFAVNYDVPGRTTIANDSDEAITLDLANFDFSVNLVTQVVPRESTQAFLAAKFIYDRPLPLYGSSMTVFVDGAFAGYTRMPTALPQSEVVLPMGQDRRIVVSAESQGGQDGQGGIINKRRTETTNYLFEITNRRSAPTSVEVMDLYPVAQNKSIKVEVPRSATVPDERDIGNQPGLVVWRKSVEPGESWEIRHQYSVSYPADQVLTRQ